MSGTWSDLSNRIAEAAKTQAYAADAEGWRPLQALRERTQLFQEDAASLTDLTPVEIEFLSFQSWFEAFSDEGDSHNVEIDIEVMGSTIAFKETAKRVEERLIEHLDEYRRKDPST